MWRAPGSRRASLGRWEDGACLWPTYSTVECRPFAVNRPLHPVTTFILAIPASTPTL
jgi:hypothetical protein